MFRGGGGGHADRKWWEQNRTHSLTETNDKIQFHGNYFFKKGGEPLWKGGGGTDPLPPPPLNPPLLFYVDYSVMVTIRIRVRDLVRLWYVLGARLSG